MQAHKPVTGGVAYRSGVLKADGKIISGGARMKPIIRNNSSERRFDGTNKGEKGEKSSGETKNEGKQRFLAE